MLGRPEKSSACLFLSTKENRELPVLFCQSNRMPASAGMTQANRWWTSEEPGQPRSQPLREFGWVEIAVGQKSICGLFHFCLIAFGSILFRFRNRLKGFVDPFLADRFAQGFQIGLLSYFSELVHLRVVGVIELHAPFLFFWMTASSTALLKPFWAKVPISTPRMTIIFLRGQRLEELLVNQNRLQVPGMVQYRCGAHDLEQLEHPRWQVCFGAVGNAGLQGRIEFVQVTVTVLAPSALKRLESGFSGTRIFSPFKSAGLYHFVLIQLAETGPSGQLKHEFRLFSQRSASSSPVARS